MKKILLALAAGAAMTGLFAQCTAKAEAGNEAAAPADSDTIPVVYFISEITPENLIRIYDSLGVDASDRKVAVKISTGESMRSNHLSPELIAPLVSRLNGTLVECNTAYAGNRNSTEAHRRAIEEHGYAAIAPVDIMDAEGDTAITVTNGFHLPYDLVGKDLTDYDFMLVLSHFKGHAMGGFGGALKNISIGIGSSAGKAWIHTAGKTADVDSLWSNLPEQDAFLESMADAASAVVDYMGKDNMVYINVANNLSVDCDCNGNPAEPKMADLGIFASKDPVALDRACVDMVFNAGEDSGNADLIERIDSRHGTHILPSAEQLGVGTQRYRLVRL